VPIEDAMAFAARHPAPLVAVVAAFVVIGSVFAFARPVYHPRYESKMVDFSKVQYYSPATVRKAFRIAGVRLHVASRFTGMVLMTNVSLPVRADALQVVLGPRKGSGSFGPKLEAYDERFGNVMVTYGDADRRLLRRIELAVSSLH
jgi:hypothetical protein